jgi:hypothetical protein
MYIKHEAGHTRVGCPWIRAARQDTTGSTGIFGRFLRVCARAVEHEIGVYARLGAKKWNISSSNSV